jgi:hypothetical protein
MGWSPLARGKNEMAGSEKQNWRTNSKAPKSHVQEHGDNQQMIDKR